MTKEQIAVRNALQIICGFEDRRFEQQGVNVLVHSCHDVTYTMNPNGDLEAAEADAPAQTNERTTLIGYKAQIEARGQRIGDVPQPYGRYVAEFIRTNRASSLPDALDMAELAAHLLHDLDVHHGKA